MPIVSILSSDESSHGKSLHIMLVLKQRSTSPAKSLRTNESALAGFEYQFFQLILTGIINDLTYATNFTIEF